MRMLCNDGWFFAKGAPEGFAPVSLPHDWLIADTQNLYESGVGWYERRLDARVLKAGQRLSLRFDGVFMDCALFVNGQAAGEWKYGFTAFEFDVTDLLRRDGADLVRLRVNYQAPAARWYTGAGIYRDVWLVIREACHFVPGGIYVTTFQEGGRWRYRATAEVEAGERTYEVRHTLLDETGGPVDDPAAWDVDDPRLYTLRSVLLADGQVTDAADTRVGFRAIEFTTDRGFFLNGRPLKLNGVCLHQDMGPLGAAALRGAVRRQFVTLKQMGVNALRAAHNPPSEDFMDLADEMGFLVLSECLDIWRHAKNPYDYARFFDEWIDRDAASWLRRDRNRPSVILWSVGNEIHDTHIDAEEGAATLRRMLALVARHDPEGHAPATLCSNYMPWENTQKCADIVKIIGYNYGEALYEAHHAAHPDWVIYGSETCSTVQSRGIYHFPLFKAILADDDLQCSALGNSVTSWGAKSVEACLRFDRDTPYSLGQFLWAGQDYLGEPTPYHTKSAYLGHIDTAGFPKDSYYICQAAWTDVRRAPMAHLFPYWDFSPGQVVDVRVCSNAPRVALFLDGASLGAVALEGRLIADWQVPYRSGVLRAVAYDEAGAAVAEAERRSFGDTAALVLREETFGGLLFVTVTAVDADGNPVDNACDRVKVTADGGRLLGLDNGDATDWEQYTAGSRRLFSGKLLAIVKPEGDGTARVTAALDKSDVPIRKIELARDGWRVTAQIFPADATYDDLAWRLTDAGGIDSPLGALKVAGDGRSAEIVPHGDGAVYIRCAAKNGRAHPTVISLLPMTIEGVGQSFLDPYVFLSAGLYNAGNVEMTNGNERGVATPRTGESHVGFTGLDFGDYGSDEVTLPLFPLDKEPFDFELWEGMPSEGGEKLCTVRWDKGSVWNTYQDITVKLPRRLKGVTALCLVFRQKVHIKGFRFTRLQKAFERLPAAACDRIYGDAYTVRPPAVEGIGNNVTLAFEHMDFGETGAGRVALRWRSRLAKNAIQLLFEGPEGQRRQVVEALRAEAYTEAVFPLDRPVFGPQTVQLVFLPGCELDLEWIRFEA